MTLDEIFRIGIRSAIIGATSLALVFLLFWLFKRQKAAAGVKKPRKMQSFVVNLPPDKLIQELRQAIKATDYQIEETVQTDADFMLSEEATATSFGFYYPIYLTPLEKYQTQVEIGIESKAFQMGPVVKKHHRRCVETIRTLLGGPSLS